MFKTDFIDALLERHGCTKIQAEQFVDDFFDTVIDACLSEGFVQITGYGTFEYKLTPEHKAMNPKTRKEILAPPSSSIRFKPGKKMKNF